ncbi:MAG TPA: hypothetical protein VKM55_27410 [Candidatus Lokiarchaeia archaeon]|nr:hypothetical protein [Candidatus Lokiarchaeia archaeon]
MVNRGLERAFFHLWHGTTKPVVADPSIKTGPVLASCVKPAHALDHER